MKKIVSSILVISFLCLLGLPALSQQEKQAQKKNEQELTTQEITEKMPRRTRPAYSRAGRKDPFRDLIAQQEARRTTEGAEGPVVSVENLNVIGIVKARGTFTAIVTGPEEFPLFIKVGHKFSDGYVLSIDESKVVFRKTTERGSPLFKPRDIVKEINPEERR